MENTDSIFFKDDSPKWFIAIGEQWSGPLTPSQINQKIRKGEISLLHFICEAGEKQPKRICDHPDFQILTPHAPKTPPLSQMDPPKKNQPNKDQEQKWFLFVQNAPVGPVSATEVQMLLAHDRIKPDTYAWCSGMLKWEPLNELIPFDQGSPKIIPAEKKIEKKTEKPRDRRRSPRKPLVAQIFLSNNESVIQGICRDISIGGMQILTNKLPGTPGTRIRINVSDLTAKGGKTPKPFTAEGVVGRILEDRRGFSLRFERMSEDAKRAIVQYLTAE